MDIPVLHLVNRFWIGGAERQFVERLRLHPPGFSALVGCLELSGPMLEQVRSLGYEPVLFPLRDRCCGRTRSSRSPGWRR